LLVISGYSGIIGYAQYMLPGEAGDTNKGHEASYEAVKDYRGEI
jgi:hypothetical protein